MSEHAQDDETWIIEADDVLLRRIARAGDINMLKFDQRTNEYRVSSGAFSREAEGCSVFVERILRSVGLGPPDVSQQPQNVVFAVPVSVVTEAGLDARPDPWPPDSDGHPRDAAHALIINPQSFGKKRLVGAYRALAAASVIVHG